MEKMLALTVEDIWGESEFSQQMVEFACSSINYYGPLLFQGEYGTGKEFLAMVIHNMSQRDRGYMFKIISYRLQELLEQDDDLRNQILLFCAGRVPLSRATLKKLYKTGCLVCLNDPKPSRYLHFGNTVLTFYFDEISLFNKELQNTLYYLITTNEWGPFLSKRYRCRFICSSTVPLESKIENHTFLEVLYKEISGIALYFKPLRERINDIPVLTHKFLSKLAPNASSRLEGVTENALQFLMQYSWPGNIAELKSVIDTIYSQPTNDTHILKLEALYPLIRQDHRRRLYMGED